MVSYCLGLLCPGGGKRLLFAGAERTAKTEGGRSAVDAPALESDLNPTIAPTPLLSQQSPGMLKLT
jgi:hypothetical protein